jgi:hypothetical protein
MIQKKVPYMKGCPWQKKNTTKMVKRNAGPASDPRQADVGVTADVEERVAQLKSCLTSFVGGKSAGCLGSIRRLEAKVRPFSDIRCNAVITFSDKDLGYRLVVWIFQIRIADILELQVSPCSYRTLGIAAYLVSSIPNYYPILAYSNTLALDNSCQFMIFVEVDQLFLR